MRKVLVLLPVLLAACIPATPIVSDFNSDSVKIQISQLANQEEAKANALAEANRICAKKGRHAEPASSRTVADYTTELLYLCL